MKKAVTNLLLVCGVLFPSIFIAQPLHLKVVYSPTATPVSHSHFALSRPDNSVLDFGYYQSMGLITKLDSTGSFKWAKSYLLNANTAFLASFVDATNSEDSTFAAIATLKNNAVNSYSAYCLKFKANGDTLWCRQIINNSLYSIVPHSINSTIDSGFVICGRAISSSSVSGPNSHAFVAKITKTGALDWLKTLSTSFYASNAYTIRQTLDSGYICIGGIQNGSAVDWCTSLTKLNKFGNLSWQKKYCSQVNQNNDDIGFDILEEKNGYLCFLSVGTYKSYLLRTDFFGNTLWIKKYSSDSYFYSNDERPIHLRKINSKTRQIVFKGPNSFLGWGILCDTLGNVQTAFQTYYTDFDVVKLKNKNLMLVGNPPNIVFKNSFPSYGQIAIVVTDSMGTGNSPCYMPQFISASNQTLTNTAFTSTLTNNGTLSAVQATIDPLFFSDSTGCILLPTAITESQRESISVYPNPSNGNIYIQTQDLIGKTMDITIYNCRGQKIEQVSTQIEKNETAINTSELPASLYLYTISLEGKKLKTGKLIVEK